jgi:hypothetical protein
MEKYKICALILQYILTKGAQNAHFMTKMHEFIDPLLTKSKTL